MGLSIGDFERIFRRIQAEEWNKRAGLQENSSMDMEKINNAGREPVQVNSWRKRTDHVYERQCGALRLLLILTPGLDSSSSYSLICPQLNLNKLLPAPTLAIAKTQANAVIWTLIHDMSIDLSTDSEDS